MWVISRVMGKRKKYISSLCPQWNDRAHSGHLINNSGSFFTKFSIIYFGLLTHNLKALVLIHVCACMMLYC